MKIYHRNVCKRNLLTLTESAVLVLKINNGFWMRHRYDSVHVLLFKVFYWKGEEKRARKAIWDCWLEWFCPDLNGVTQIASSANCILPRSQCLFHLYPNHHHLLHLLSLVSYPSQTEYHVSWRKGESCFWQLWIVFDTQSRVAATPPDFRLNIDTFLCLSANSNNIKPTKPMILI